MPAADATHLPPHPPHRPALAHAALLLALAFLLFGVRLGDSGLSASEGFRAIPAWEMLRSGDLVVTTLFDTPYVRKPPGIVWAIAASSAALGETEAAARLVSALATTLGALLLWWSCSRWFGRVPGLCAGAAYFLTPVLWMPARSAEIEALHNLFVLPSGLLLLHRLAAPDPSPRPLGARLWMVGGLGVSVAAMALTKGPAGLPALAGILLGACLARRSLRPLHAWDLWGGLALGAGLVGLWALLLAARLRHLDLPPVLEDARFLWREGKTLGVLVLVPAALAGALPWALALPFALRRHDDTPGAFVGAGAAWGVIVGLAFYCVIGVDNTRYAMPALLFVPVAYAAALAAHAHARGTRRLWGWRLFLGAPALPMLTLILAGVGYCQWFEHWRDVRHSGRAAGVALAAALPDHATIVADELLDTRPEVLWYAQRTIAARGGHLRVVWAPGLPPERVPAEAFVLLRTDNEPRMNRKPEMALLDGRNDLFDRDLRVEGAVHKFEFMLLGPARSGVPIPQGGENP